MADYQLNYPVVVRFCFATWRIFCPWWYRPSFEKRNQMLPLYPFPPVPKTRFSRQTQTQEESIIGEKERWIYRISPHSKHGRGKGQFKLGGGPKPFWAWLKTDRQTVIFAYSGQVWLRVWVLFQNGPSFFPLPTQNEFWFPDSLFWDVEFHVCLVSQNKCTYFIFLSSLFIESSVFGKIMFLLFVLAFSSTYSPTRATCGWVQFCLWSQNGGESGGARHSPFPFPSFTK